MNDANLPMIGMSPGGVHPLFRGGNKTALVQDVKNPALFGVARVDGRFVVALPPGYGGDECELRMLDGKIAVINPGLPPLLCDPDTGGYVLLEECHLENLKRDERTR